MVDAPDTPDATIEEATTGSEPTEPDEPVDSAPSENVARCAIQDGEGGYDDIGCDVAHDAEFAGTIPAPDGAAPVDEVEYDIALVTACRDVVEQLSGESLAQFTIEAGYVSTTGPGEEFSGEIGCWAQSAAVESLVGSLTEIDLATALGEFRTLASLEPGDCYELTDNYGSSSIVKEAVCGEPLSNMYAGDFELPDGPYPDDEALAATNDRCVQVTDDSGLAVFGDSVASLSPFETEWVALGIRTVACESYLYADFSTCYTDDPETEETFDEPVSCRDPHKFEFVGLVPTPVDVLPDDLAEAKVILARACLPKIEEVTGIVPDTFGTGVAYVAPGELGGEQIGDIECYVSGPTGNLLVGSLVTASLDDSITGDAVRLITLDIGSCFVFADDAFDLGLPVDCGAPDARMHLGDAVLDAAVYPGLDEARLLRTDACTALLAATRLDADPASVSGTMINDTTWTAIGYGRTTCDAAPL